MANIDYKRVVPWNSIEEWKNVYKLVYSPDTNEKNEALYRMTMWKSRSPKLNLGIECTLYLLQSMLRDEERQQNPLSSLSENDLKLMYSTAIIRFINLTSHLGQVDLKHQPIAAIAKKAGIPDWLVSIRHEATHSKMPSLAILRPGANYALQWLQGNYWNIEEENSYPLHWPESKRGAAKILRKKEELSKATTETSTDSNTDLPVPVNKQKQFQFSVSMFIHLLREMTCNQTLNQVQSRALRRYGFNLWQKTLSKPVSEKEAKNLQLPLSKIRYVMMGEIDRCLTRYTADNQTSKKEALISAVVNSMELPTENGGTCSDFYPLWKLVQQWASLPFFLEKLGERALSDEPKRSVVLKLIAELCQTLLNNRINPADSKYLKFDKSIEEHDWTNLIYQLLQTPHEDTWNAVSRLCTMQDPNNKKMQNDIACVLKLYLDSQKGEGQGQAEDLANISIEVPQVYGQEYLQPVSKKQKKSPVHEDSPAITSAQTAEVVDTWAFATEYSWSEITIGNLPASSDIEELDILDAEWTGLEPAPKSEFDFNVTKKQSAEPFDWNSLGRQRRKRGGLPKFSTVTV